MARYRKMRIAAGKVRAKLLPARRAVSRAGVRMRAGAQRKMKNMGVGRKSSLLVLPALVMLIVLAGYLNLPRMQTARFLPALGEVSNPRSGIALSAQEDQDAQAQTSLVWVMPTWRELEPEQGVYAFEQYDEQIGLDQWRERGAQLVFRLVLDPQDGRVGLPDWLLEKTGGKPYGDEAAQRYAPDYADPALQDAHFLLLQAIEEHYGEDIAYVEMGSLGADGAWKSAEGAPKLPMTDVTSVYIWQYFTAFPEQCVLSPGPYREAMLPEGGAYLSELGRSEATWDWINLFRFGGWDGQIDARLRPEAEYGLNAPAGAWLADEAGEMLEQDAQQLERMALESRATYICAEYTSLSDEARQALGQIAQKIGYRFWVRQAQWPQRVRTDYSLYVDLYVENDGVAPAPCEMPVYLALLDAQGAVVCKEKTEADAKNWRPGSAQERIRITIPYDLPKGEYTLAIGLCGAQGEPAARFAMDGETAGLWHVLGAVEVY